MRSSPKSAMPIPLIKKLLAAFALAILGGAHTALAAETLAGAGNEAVIGVIDVNEPGYRSEFVSPTLLYLSKALPEYRLRTVEIPAYQAAETIGQTSPDFVIGPSDPVCGKRRHRRGLGPDRPLGKSLPKPRRPEGEDGGRVAP